MFAVCIILAQIIRKMRSPLALRCDSLLISLRIQSAWHTIHPEVDTNRHWPALEAIALITTPSDRVNVFVQFIIIDWYNLSHLLQKNKSCFLALALLIQNYCFIIFINHTEFISDSWKMVAAKCSFYWERSIPIIVICSIPTLDYLDSVGYRNLG